MLKINQKGRAALAMQQQTQAIHIARAEPQKSQMIKRNHRFIFSKVNGSMVFVTIARRPLVATPS